jgi:hypothetical protein
MAGQDEPASDQEPQSAMAVAAILGGSWPVARIFLPGSIHPYRRRSSGITNCANSWSYPDETQFVGVSVPRMDPGTAAAPALGSGVRASFAAGVEVLAGRRFPLGLRRGRCRRRCWPKRPPAFPDQRVHHL